MNARTFTHHAPSMLVVVVGIFSESVRHYGRCEGKWGAGIAQSIVTSPVWGQLLTLVF